MEHHQQMLILLNESDVHMENLVLEKIQFIDNRLFIPVIQIGKLKKKKKKIKIKQNLNVHMVMNVIEKIQIILMSIIIQRNDLLKLKLNNVQLNVKVTHLLIYLFKKQKKFLPLAIEDDDDDGLPNEYDYNDSFIDNEDLDSTDEESKFKK